MKNEKPPSGLRSSNYHNEETLKSHISPKVTKILLTSDSDTLTTNLNQPKQQAFRGTTNTSLIEKIKGLNSPDLEEILESSFQYNQKLASLTADSLKIVHSMLLQLTPEMVQTPKSVISNDYMFKKGGKPSQTTRPFGSRKTSATESHAGPIIKENSARTLNDQIKSIQIITEELSFLVGEMNKTAHSSADSNSASIASTKKYPSMFSDKQGKSSTVQVLSSFNSTGPNHDESNLPEKSIEEHVTNQIVPKTNKTPLANSPNNQKKQEKQPSSKPKLTLNLSKIQTTGNEENIAKLEPTPNPLNKNKTARHSERDRYSLPHVGTIPLSSRGPGVSLTTPSPEQKFKSNTQRDFSLDLKKSSVGSVDAPSLNTQLSPSIRAHPGPEVDLVAIEINDKKGTADKKKLNVTKKTKASLMSPSGAFTRVTSAKNLTSQPKLQSNKQMSQSKSDLRREGNISPVSSLPPHRSDNKHIKQFLNGNKDKLLKKSSSRPSAKSATPLISPSDLIQNYVTPAKKPGLEKVSRKELEMDNSPLQMSNLLEEMSVLSERSRDGKENQPSEFNLHEVIQQEISLAKKEKNVIKLYMKSQYGNQDASYHIADHGNLYQKKYLIDAKWWRNWKEFVQFDSKDGEIVSEQVFYRRPASIQIAHMIKNLQEVKESNAEPILQDNLLEHHDFEAVNKKVFDAFANWYGCDYCISRLLKTDPARPGKFVLDLYPKPRPKSTKAASSKEFKF